VNCVCKCPICLSAVILGHGHKSAWERKSRVPPKRKHSNRLGEVAKTYFLTEISRGWPNFARNCTIFLSAVMLGREHKSAWERVKSRVPPKRKHSNLTGGVVGTYFLTEISRGWPNFACNCTIFYSAVILGREQKSAFETVKAGVAPEK